MSEPKKLNLFSRYAGIVSSSGTITTDNSVNLRIKKVHQDAIIPKYMSTGAACFDLFACIHEPKILYPAESIIIPTGISVEIPEGYVMKVFSRSGYGFKHKVRLLNCVGIIDSDYRGEIKIGLINDRETELGHDPLLTINPGDRVAQAIIEQVLPVSFEVVDELSETERGEGGFGSTGK